MAAFGCPTRFKPIFSRSDGVSPSGYIIYHPKTENIANRIFNKNNYHESTIEIRIAVCTVDGSPNEMPLRLVGLAVCVIGAIIAKFAPEAEGNDGDEEERKVEHEPYPEE